MKTCYSIFLLTLIFLLISSCNKDKDEYFEIVPIKNNSLPKKKDLKNGELKILFIGSSWLKNTYYMTNKVFHASGVKATIGGMYGSGIELKALVNACKRDEMLEFNYSKDGEDWDVMQRSIKEVLKLEDWDIIVYQQSAQSSFYWDSYQPYLNQFRDMLLSEATNEKVCLVLNQTWTPAKNGPYIKMFGFNNQMDMYIASLNANKMAVSQSGIDVIIPSGTAVYFLRNSSIENDMDLTHDQLHLDPGVGEYLTACTVFMALINPIFGTSIEGNTYRTNKGTPVTDLNAPIIQDCAIRAVKDPYFLLNNNEQ